MSKCIVWCLLVVSLVGIRLAEAQSGRKIGVLSGSSHSSTTADVEAFRQGLRDLGYNEKRNIMIDDRYADGKLDRLPQFVNELL
jgi:ABC-type uncharacterized transport system substrate-binding protein